MSKDWIAPTFMCIIVLTLAVVVRVMFLGLL
jgi:hypothetical protein